MRLSKFIAMKDRDVLQACDVCSVHRKRLSAVNDRVVGTRKGTERQYAGSVEGL